MTKPYDLIDTPSGRLRVHAAGDCVGPNCVIHNPSHHHMRDWPLHWRADRGLMERICEHGVGHPDPDHLDFVRHTKGGAAAETESVHGCDGCCAQHD
jgi:hypothetical protein